jgi:hypothetical protein
MLHGQQIDVAFFGAVKLMVAVATPLQLREMKRLMTQRALIRHNEDSRKTGRG